MHRLLVGEIGVSRDDFLYSMRWWEMRSVINGYRRRERLTWTVARWQTFMLMHNGMTDLKKAGIYSASDLLPFPWEKADTATTVSDEEIERLQRMMREENARLKAEQSS